MRATWSPSRLGLLLLFCCGPLSAQAESADLAERLVQMEARVQQLEGLLGGPMAHLIGENRQQHGQLEARIAELEAQVQALRAGTAPVAAPVPGSEAPAVRITSPADRRAETAAGAALPAPGGGAFAVVLLSSTNSEAVDRELTRLRGLNIQAEKREVMKDGQVSYRLVVAGFDSRDTAEGYAGNVKQMADLATHPWVYSE